MGGDKITHVRTQHTTNSRSGFQLHISIFQIVFNLNEIANYTKGK